MSVVDIEGKLLKIEKYFKNDTLFRYSPSFKSSILLKLRSLLITKTKINFLIYWGIGHKKIIDNIDNQAIFFQQKLINDISDILELDYSIQYIITDTHAMINNIPISIINSYSNSAQEVLQVQGYNTMLMSQLLRTYHIDNMENFIANYNIEHLISNSKYKSLLNGLLKQSNMPLHMGDSIEYLKSNLIENAIVEEEFPTYIFVTYSVPETKLLLPNLPKLYTYADEKKQIKRPWFNEGKE